MAKYSEFCKKMLVFLSNKFFGGQFKFFAQKT